MISVGIDAGAATTKAVIMKDTTVIGWKVCPTGFDFSKAARDLYEEVLARAGIAEGDVGKVYATGYGKNAIPFAGRTLSEITAHARGVFFLYPEVAGVIDIGGQDSKVITVDQGRVQDFLMNDKCAAGTGKFLEYSAKALEVSIEELAELALTSDDPAKISSMCTVFAESEVISLRAKGYAKKDIAAGLVGSIAQRIAVMAKRMGFKKNVAFVGGVAKNRAMKEALEAELGFTLFVPEEPQITGALGAALQRERKIITGQKP
ncbi:MAG TPA: acyl-CoA dehydratase activase [Methanomassiliicoccales archaeon]